MATAGKSALPLLHILAIHEIGARRVMRKRRLHRLTAIVVSGAIAGTMSFARRGETAPEDGYRTEFVFPSALVAIFLPLSEGGFCSTREVFESPIVGVEIVSLRADDRAVEPQSMDAAHLNKSS